MSYAHFISDENGEIDLSRMSPVNGTYSGVLPMGLITGLLPEPGIRITNKLLVRDVMKPLKVSEIYGM